MRKGGTFRVAALILCALSAHSSPQFGADPEDSAEIQLGAEIEALGARLAIPGLAYGVIQNGKLLFDGAVGHFGTPDQPFTVRTPLDIASISKSIAAGSDRLSNPFRLLHGDVRSSPFAMAFFRNFVASSPRGSLQSPDWTIPQIAELEAELDAREALGSYRFDSELVAQALLEAFHGGDTDRAGDLLELALHRYPDLVPSLSWLELANAVERESLETFAVQLADRLVRTRPTSPWVLSAGGDTYMKYGDPLKAVATWSRVASLPNQAEGPITTSLNAEAWNSIGEHWLDTDPSAYFVKLSSDPPLPATESQAKAWNLTPLSISLGNQTYAASRRPGRDLFMPRPECRSALCASIALCLLTYFTPTPTGGQTRIDPSSYQDLQYRLVGPFRASRTVGGVGIPTQPNVFFVGVNNGGVWKTDDFGRTWVPIFDDAPTGSVGDIAVSPSHPNVIYVGTGEGLHRPDLAVGDGIFKSTDGGETWKHIGLADVQQVGRLIVHPTNPDIVFVAGLGHPYGPNEERGIFRTLNGGETWEQTLFIDENTGAIQVEFDPTNPDILFADLWEHREGPWENARFLGSNSGLYKSTDGGSTWRRLSEGLPTAEQGLGRIGVGIAPSDPNRMYATVGADGDLGGLYRSDDAGESWHLVHSNPRVWGRAGDFAELKVHPKNPDVVFSGNIASYRSDDGGHTWTSIKGAPGGDDYHRIWINPLNPKIMLFVADQGATITVNGGRTWSSWYNQPTAQLYHVTTTQNRFPYWVCGGQQESGAICISSRGSGGQISFRDWLGIGADEYAYVAPDPLDPNIVYGGRIMRFDWRTGQAQNVAPETLRSGDYRILRTMPLLFHPQDPQMLLFATNVLWKTTSGGQDWQIISPDLTREQPEVPASVGDFRTTEMDTMDQRAVIYAVGPSPLDVGTIWAGTDDGLVHVTTDGGQNWQDVTPPELRPWDKVSQVDAGHFDVDTAYIAINAIRRDDMRPHIYRTRDGGKSWDRIVAGLHEMGPVNVVREDPAQPGLLYAGTERTVYFSANDGDTWHSLRQNLPPSSMRDLVIHENDLVVGTHGRSIWILDDISPLRELAAAATSGKPHLFTTSLATRVRWNMFSDTPLPPEEPTGENPPDGAILDYHLPKGAESVVLEILDSSKDVVRRYSSADPTEVVDPETLPHPTYWIRPAQQLGTTPGHHRFVWDLRRESPRGARRQFSIAAVLERTPSGPHGPFVPPGTYTVRLSVDGQVSEQPLEVQLDPRVTLDEASLRLQTDLSMRCYDGYHLAQDIREAIDRELEQATADDATNLQALRGDDAPGEPDIQYDYIRAAPTEEENLVDLQYKLLWVMYVLQSADAPPTSQTQEAVTQLEASLSALRARWDSLR